MNWSTWKINLIYFVSNEFHLFIFEYALIIFTKKSNDYLF